MPAHSLCDEVRRIGDELRIETERVAYRSIYLFGSIVIFLQLANRCLDQLVERRDVVKGSCPDKKFGCCRHSFLPTET